MVLSKTLVFFLLISFADPLLIWNTSNKYKKLKKESILFKKILTNKGDTCIVITVVDLASHLKKVIDTKFSIWYYIKAVSLIAN